MAKQSDSAPEFVKYVGPVIETLTALGGSGRPDEVRSAIAKGMNISEEEQAQPLPSGVQSRFENQVHWARFYLAKGGYIDASRHGVWTLTERARSLGKISAAQAREIYRSVAAEFRKAPATDTPGADEQVAPATDAEHLFVNYRQAVATTLQSLPAAGFERFCQRLLRESGFEEVTITGRSGDGGIDAHHTGNCRDLGEPAAVSFRFELDGERHGSHWPCGMAESDVPQPLRFDLCTCAGTPLASSRPEAN